MVRWLTLGYYRWLRKICNDHSELRRLRKCCSRCEIRILTSCSNEKRPDIGCAFGCRKECERERTNERGRIHYQTVKGKANKSARNRERSLIDTRESKNDHKAEPTTLLPPQPVSVFDPNLLRYIAYLMSFTPGSPPPIAQIEQYLNEALSAVIQWLQCAILRQRSLPERGG